jgi:hypothetical protein
MERWRSKLETRHRVRKVEKSQNKNSIAIVTVPRNNVTSSLLCRYYYYYIIDIHIPQLHNVNLCIYYLYRLRYYYLFINVMN